MVCCVLYAGAPPPRTLKASEVASERESVALYLSHLRGLLSQLPTTADQDVAILQEQRQLQQQQQSQASQQKGGAALISALAGKAGECRVSDAVVATCWGGTAAWVAPCSEPPLLGGPFLYMQRPACFVP